MTRVANARWPVVTASLLLSAVFVWLAARRLDLADVGAALDAMVLWPWVPIAAASYLSGHVIRGMRCQALVRREARISLLTASNVVVLGYAVNNLLPARLGEFVRASKLAERTGIPYVQALTLTFAERLLDGMAIAVIFIVTTAGLGISGPLVDAAQLGVPIVFAASAVMFLCVANVELLPRLASLTTTFLPKALRSRVIAFAVDVSRGLSCIRGFRLSLRLVSLSFVVWLFEAGMFLALLPAAGLVATPDHALFSMSTTNLGILLPSSPGYVGPFHYFCMESQVLLGSPAATALAYATVVHLTFFVPVTIWGVLVLFVFGIRLGAILGLVRGAEQAAGTALRETELDPTADVASLRRTDPPPSPATVAIVDTIAPWEDAELSPEQRRAVLRDVASFVDTQVRCLPTPLRAAYGVGMFGFRAFALVRRARPFGSAPRSVRRRLVRSWAFGPLGVTRQLFRVVYSLALLAFYEHAAVQATLKGAP